MATHDGQTELRSLFDLSTAEAYAIAVQVVNGDLPDQAAIENEDWGRDLVLQTLAALSDRELAALGLRRDETDENP